MSDYIDRAALGIGLCNRDVFENKGYADDWLVADICDTIKHRIGGNNNA